MSAENRNPKLLRESEVASKKGTESLDKKGDQQKNTEGYSDETLVEYLALWDFCAFSFLFFVPICRRGAQSQENIFEVEHSTRIRYSVGRHQNALHHPCTQW